MPFNEDTEILPICWECGGLIEITLDEHYQDRQFFKCPNCTEELDRLADLEADHVEAIDRLQKMDAAYAKLTKLLYKIKNLIS